MKKREMPKKKKNKKKKRIVLLLLVVLLGCAGWYVKAKFFTEKEVATVKVVDQLDKYGYTLEEGATKYQKKLFSELKKILSQKQVDEEAYAKVVAQSFLADYFTLSSKTSKNHVGGVQYVLQSYQDSFVKKSTDEVYKYVESNIYGNRKQELPTVSNVEVVDITTEPHDYLDKTDEKAYVVELAITYEKNMDYQENATLVLVHTDKKLEIVKMS